MTTSKIFFCNKYNKYTGKKVNFCVTNWQEIFIYPIKCTVSMTTVYSSTTVHSCCGCVSLFIYNLLLAGSDHVPSTIRFSSSMAALLEFNSPL